MRSIDIIIMSGYFVALLGLVVLMRRARNMDDFAVGSRQIPALIVGATLSATYIGPGYSMGLANKVASEGFIWLLIFFAFSVQTAIVGLWIAPRLRHFNHAYTLGDIMGYRYGKLVKFMAGILSVALTAGIVGVIARAAGELIHEFLGLPFYWAVAVSTIVVIVYASFGGIKTIILTDVLQFIVLAISIPLTIFIMAAQTPGGMTALLDHVPNEAFSLGTNFPPIVLFGLFISFLLGETLIPPYANRALVASDASAARQGFLLAAVFSAAWFIVCAAIGGFSPGVVPEAGDAPFFTALNTVLPAGMLGLAIAAIISIIMSSQDSLLNAASVSFNNDIVALISRRFSTGQAALTANRWLTVVIGVLSALFAVTVPGIVDALLYCYTLWAPTIVLPLIIAVFYEKAHPYAGLAAIIAGGITTAIWEWGLGAPGQVPSLFIGVCANQIAFWSANFIVKGPPSHPWLQPIPENVARTGPPVGLE